MSIDLDVFQINHRNVGLIAWENQLGQFIIHQMKMKWSGSVWEDGAPLEYNIPLSNDCLLFYSCKHKDTVAETVTVY